MRKLDRVDYPARSSLARARWLHTTRQYNSSILIYRRFPYKVKNMENKLKNAALSDIGNDALRQYIDAQSTFTAWEEAVKRAMEVRGRMFWRQMGGTDYLIKESRRAQTSLGPRSPEREAILRSSPNPRRRSKIGETNWPPRSSSSSA